MSQESENITNDEFDATMPEVISQLSSIRRLARVPYATYRAVEGTSLEDKIYKLMTSDDGVRKAKLDHSLRRFGLTFDYDGNLTFRRRRGA